MKLGTTAAATLIALAGLVSTSATQAAEVEVKMLNKGANGTPMVFDPAFIRIAPGDTVRFVPTDKGHDAASIAVMLPEGATLFEGKMNQETAVAFDKSGVYGVKCKPHYGLGMVALVVVGEPANVDAAKAVKQPGKARQAFEALFAQLSK